MAKRKRTIARDPQGRELSSYEETEEEDDDLNRIVPDGGRVRVRLDLMDAMQRSVANDASAPRVVDAFGQSDRYSLSKPGARYLAANPDSTDHAIMATRQQLLADAYAEYDRQAENAWRK
jgi:hypothetical protein